MDIKQCKKRGGGSMEKNSSRQKKTPTLCPGDTNFKNYVTKYCLNR